MSRLEDCKYCTEKCPQEKLACEIAKGRMYATDEVIKLQKELQRYKDLEEQGRLVELPCERVYRIINYDSPKYALVDSIPIEMMPIYELKYIDNGNIFFSAKEKAEAKLKELKNE